MIRISSWYWSQVCVPNTQWSQAIPNLQEPGAEKALLQVQTRRKDKQKKPELQESFQQSPFLGKLKKWPGYFWGQSLCSWGQVMVRSWCSCKANAMLSSDKTGSGPKAPPSTSQFQAQARRRGPGWAGYPSGVQEGIYPAPSLRPPTSARPWLRRQVSAGSSCRARSQTPPNQLNYCYYRGECWFQAKNTLT